MKTSFNIAKMKIKNESDLVRQFEHKKFALQKFLKSNNTSFSLQTKKAYHFKAQPRQSLVCPEYVNQFHI